MDDMFNRAVSEYNRAEAVAYAHKWSLNRNPNYYNFENNGGDCTNFASQVIYEGSTVMDYSPANGWYYINVNKRSPSWTGVNFLYDYLTNNKNLGPFADEVSIRDIQIGDLIQLSFEAPRHFQHSLIVVKTGSPPDVSNVKICTHTYDRDNYSLSNYNWRYIRFIHIIGVKTGRSMVRCKS